MALADKEYTRMYSTDSSDGDYISTKDLNDMETSFNSNEYIVDDGQFSMLAPLLWQIQKMQEELDELRRYVESDEIAAEIDGSNLPKSKPKTTGLLWSDKGIVKVS
jgi:hypothetical protein